MKIAYAIFLLVSAVNAATIYPLASLQSIAPKKEIMTSRREQIQLAIAGVLTDPTCGRSLSSIVLIDDSSNMKLTASLLPAVKSTEYNVLALCYIKLMKSPALHYGQKIYAHAEALPRELIVALRLYSVVMGHAINNFSFSELVHKYSSSLALPEIMRGIQTGAFLTNDSASGIALLNYILSLMPGSGSPVNANFKLRVDLSVVLCDIASSNYQVGQSLIFSALRLKQRSSNEEINAVVDIIINADIVTQQQYRVTGTDPLVLFKFLHEYLLGQDGFGYVLPAELITQLVDCIIPRMINANSAHLFGEFAVNLFHQYVATSPLAQFSSLNNPVLIQIIPAYCYTLVPVVISPQTLPMLQPNIVSNGPLLPASKKVPKRTRKRAKKSNDPRTTLNAKNAATPSLGADEDTFKLPAIDDDLLKRLAERNMSSDKSETYDDGAELELSYDNVNLNFLNE